MTVIVKQINVHIQLNYNLLDKLITISTPPYSPIEIYSGALLPIILYFNSHTVDHMILVC